MERFMPICGIHKQKKWPNSCNINLYGSEDDALGWHSDNESLFSIDKQPCRIISLSLGHSRTFQIKQCLPASDIVQHISLHSGDIVVMDGLFQHHFVHRILPGRLTYNLEIPRVNITWRWILNHSSTCSLFRKDDTT